MKILFAVNNDNVSEAIVKKYQKEYKEILSYKNVYYFNAILRELQKDKSYSRIVISEDLEPFANNNYDSIDKFLFEKYSNISEEAKSMNGDKIDIIIICADRRKKTDNMLTKVYKKDIYNAIIGQDRSIDAVCRLINRPRDKEEAKVYYGIHESELGDTESENSVSEAEVENIRAHYARLGKNEDKYVESFNNIVEQYTDTQLKIIIKYLPMNVKAVLEERSPKYQQLAITSNLTGFDAKRKTDKYKQQIRAKDEADIKKEDSVVEQLIKPKNIKSVVVPTNITTANVQKVIVPKINKPEIDKSGFNSKKDLIEISDIQEDTTANTGVNEIKEVENKEEVIPQKRGRGRPRKNPLPQEQEEKPKRGRGRPRKNPIVEQSVITETIEERPEVDLFSFDEEPEINKSEEDFNLFEMEENVQETKVEQDIDLFSISEEDEPKQKKEEPGIDLFNIDEEPETEEPNVDLFDINEETENQEPDVDLFNMNEADGTEEPDVDLFNMNQESKNEEPEEIDLFSMHEEEMPETQNLVEHNKEENVPVMQNKNVSSNFNTLLTADKKIVAFVGTTKNGTSFVVNNTAEMLSSMGINTAILDMTKTKNAYYIYTNNEESLRNTARSCMENLQNGIAEGIKANKNLTVYTEMPGEEKEYDIETILSTLLNNYSAVLIDTDFDTTPEIFEKVQEIYLVQTMDVLTIQPLTAFLRNLKSREILKPEKLKIVVNKMTRVRSLSIKTLIGGMSCYNSPSMTYMTELFNKDNIRYCEIPFEVQNYVKYLDSLVNCSISLNGYTKQLITALRELANIVYPLVNKSKYTTNNKKERRDPFSNQVNDTLNKMKNQY